MRVILFIRALLGAWFAAPLYHPQYPALIWSWTKSTGAWLRWVVKDVYVDGKFRLAIKDIGRAAVSFGHIIKCLWRMFTTYPCKFSHHHIGLSWTEAGFCGTRTWRQYVADRNRAWAAGDYLHI